MHTQMLFKTSSAHDFALKQLNKSIPEWMNGWMRIDYISVQVVKDAVISSYFTVIERVCVCVCKYY